MEILDVGRYISARVWSVLGKLDGKFGKATEWILGSGREWDYMDKTGDGTA